MSATLISRSQHLQRLQDEGYTLEIRDGAQGVYLLIHDVPYVNSSRKVVRGTLVSPLELNGDIAVSPVGNHQMWIIGEHPCNPDGTEIAEIKHSGQMDFGNGLMVNHGFSARPRGSGQYSDYYIKVTTYIRILENSARYYELDISAKTFKPIVEQPDMSVFKYADTATSRAGIGVMSGKLANQKIAIIGLGGTGSYVLEFVAKTHVTEIHLFDGDKFNQHNAFRAPGAPSMEELTNPPKVDYFTSIYSKMRHGVIPHDEKITQSNVDQLTSFSFVFICIDNPEAKEPIFNALISSKIPFVDVGMDIQQKVGRLYGQCRTTFCSPEKNDHIENHVSYATARVNDLYASNIQVAELNALNAAQAVIRWKKYFGFFDDQIREHNSVYIINTNGLTKSSLA